MPPFPLHFTSRGPFPLNGEYGQPVVPGSLGEPIPATTPLNVAAVLLAARWHFLSRPWWRDDYRHEACV